MGKQAVTSVPRDESVAFRQRESHARRRARDLSPELFCPNERLHSGSGTLATKPVAAPAQDDLHVAVEAYFRRVNKTSPEKWDDPRKSLTMSSLFDELVDDSLQQSHLATPARLSTSTRAKTSTTIRDMLETKDSERPPEVKTVVSLPQPEDISTEFSLDDSARSPREEQSFSTPVTLGSDREGVETRRRFSTGHSEENSISPEEETQPLQTGEFEAYQNARDDGDSQSREDEWSALLRRSGLRSPDDTRFSSESFKTTRSRRSSGSSYMSDEAISERASIWGNGVAKLVLKNSSRDSTPRTSTGSSIDSLRYTGPQKVPGISSSVKDALSGVRLAFVLCDAVAPENPILYASAGFAHMTGFSVEEVVGRNCRFLQGLDTDGDEVARIRDAVKKGEAYTGTLVNYKKNGTPFWNLLTLSPISDDKGVVIKYMGMQAEVANVDMKARPKETVVLDNTESKRVPLQSFCHSIAEADPSSNSHSKRTEQNEDDVPAVSTASTASVTMSGLARDRTGMCRGSNRYSLTYGNLNKPVEPRSGRHSHLGGSSSPGGRHNRSLAAHHQIEKTSSLRKTNSFKQADMLLNAARALEDEIEQLEPSAKKVPQKISTREERKGVVRNRTKIGRVAMGVIGLLRKLEGKILNRKTTGVPFNRINACDSEQSDSEVKDLPPNLVCRTTNYHFDRRRHFHSESMPPITSPSRGPLSSKSLLKDDVGSQSSSRYCTSALSDRFERRQFCIVHE